MTLIGGNFRPSVTSDHPRPRRRSIRVFADRCLLVLSNCIWREVHCVERSRFILISLKSREWSIHSGPVSFGTSSQVAGDAPFWLLTVPKMPHTSHVSSRKVGCPEKLIRRRFGVAHCWLLHRLCHPSLLLVD